MIHDDLDACRTRKAPAVEFPDKMRPGTAHSMATTRLPSKAADYYGNKKSEMDNLTSSASKAVRPEWDHDALLRATVQAYLEKRGKGTEPARGFRRLPGMGNSGRVQALIARLRSR